MFIILRKKQFSVKERLVAKEETQRDTDKEMAEMQRCSEIKITPQEYNQIL